MGSSASKYHCRLLSLTLGFRPSGGGNLKTPWLSFILLAMTVVAGTFLTGCEKTPPPAAPFVVPVVAMEVQGRPTTNYVEYIGQTLGVQDVEIRARVAGFLEAVKFTEGGLVRSNDLLYVIDDRPLKAALAQAEGVLAQADASWEKTKRDVRRYGPLWEKNAISRQQYDDAIVAELAAAATQRAALAALDAAKIQLSYTKIYSPLDGIAGKNEVSVGNLVGQGQNTLLTTVSDVSFINMRFSISEQDYLLWQRTRDQNEDGKGVFELILADGSLHPSRNSDVFVDRQVDPKTGTLMVQVRFPNPGQIVRPGQFGRVRFPSEVFPAAILVPQRCVQELQANYSVFVVGPDNKAVFRKIVLGPRIGTFYVVRDGLKPGDKVVVEGVQKMQNGVPLAVTMTNLMAEITATNPAKTP